MTPRRRLIPSGIVLFLVAASSFTPRTGFGGETATPPEPPVVGRSGLPADQGWMFGGRAGRRVASPVAALSPAAGDIALGGGNEPTVAVDPTNPMRVAYADLWQLRVSTDGGATWQPPVAPKFPPGYVPSGDPSIAFDSQGRLFLASLTILFDLGTFDTDQWDLVINQCDPTTGEVLPGYPVLVTTDSEGLIGPDKEWLTVDATPGSPFADRLYMTWTHFGASDAWIRTAYSSDQGMTWSTPVDLATDPLLGFVFGAQNAVAPNGDVYLTYHSQPGFTSGVPDGVSGQVLVSRSTDGGVTYQPPVLAFQPGDADITFNIQHRAGTIPGTSFWTQGSTQPWVLPDPNTPGRVYVVANDDPDDVHGVGDDANVYLATSTDFGATWGAPTRIDAGPGTTFQIMPTAAIDPVSGTIAVHYYDNRNANLNSDGDFLLDVFATFSDDGGATWSPEVQVNDEPFDPNPASPCRFRCESHLRGVWGASATDVFAVGNGAILHYDGANWVYQLSGGSNLFDVWGSASTDVFAVGAGGTILHYAGGPWASQASGTAELLYGVWGTASNDVFAVGDGGTILHYDGIAWSAQASGTAVTLTDVWGSAANDVFAVGDDGTILHYNGVSWSAMTSGTSEVLWKVWGSSANDVFAVGWKGGILHYNGASWSVDSSHVDRRFTGLWGSSGTDVFALDWGGEVLHYDGAVWSVMSPVLQKIWGVWGSSASDVFVVGDYARINHYDGVAWVPQTVPPMLSDPTVRIGEYNGVAVAGDVVSAVWCGNQDNTNGVPISQQTFFDRFVAATVSVALTPHRSLLLGQNRPNPMRTQTTIDFDLPTAERVKLRIYDAGGRLVRQLLDGRFAPDSYSVSWDGRDDSGLSAPPGIYWYQLDVGNRVEARHLVMAR